MYSRSMSRTTCCSWSLHADDTRAAGSDRVVASAAAQHHPVCA
jgi:hypothetical protein